MLYVRIFDRKCRDIVEYPAWRLASILHFVWAFRREWRPFPHRRDCGSWFFRLVWY